MDFPYRGLEKWAGMLLSDSNRPWFKYHHQDKKRWKIVKKMESLLLYNVAHCVSENNSTTIMSLLNFHNVQVKSLLSYPFGTSCLVGVRKN